ncbi:MAG: hypothetical protein ACRC2T_02535 [Thermoguttaceae bacterium]
MSIHTTIQSNIRNLDDLIQVLDLQQIQWTRLERIPWLRTYSSGVVYCVVEAKMNGESVIIYQDHPGNPFVFQSEGRAFHNNSNAEWLALNGHRLAEAERLRQRIEEERLREIAAGREEKRQQGIQQQAVDVLKRMEAERMAKRQERNKPAPDEGEAPPPVSLESMIGKLHQQNALRKILESLLLVDRDTGLSLYSQETLDDETIELTLRG